MTVKFISLIFLSASIALNILGLDHLFHDNENFMSLLGCFPFWGPTCFPEVICPKHNPGNIGSKKYVTI